MEEAEDDPLKALEPVMGDTRVSTPHGIAAIALSLAMKFHGISTIQDGTLYQQYKLEGRNIRELSIDMVFETAIQIEAHLLASSARIGNLVVDAIMAGAAEDEASEGATTDQS